VNIVSTGLDNDWDSTNKIALVIVGKQAWRVEPLIEYLRVQPALNKREFWPGVVGLEFEAIAFSVGYQ
jgi:hypothetical protein